MIGISVTDANTQQITLTYDIDTLPADTTISGPVDNRGTIDYIINPQDFNPTAIEDVRNSEQ